MDQGQTMDLDQIMALTIIALTMAQDLIMDPTTGLHKETILAQLNLNLQIQV